MLPDLQGGVCIQQGRTCRGTGPGSLPLDSAVLCNPVGASTARHSSPILASAAVRQLPKLSCTVLQIASPYVVDAVCTSRNDGFTSGSTSWTSSTSTDDVSGAGAGQISITNNCRQDLFIVGAYPQSSDDIFDYDVCDNNPDTAYADAWCMEFLKSGGPDGNLIHSGETARSAGVVPDGVDAYFGIYASPWTGELAPLPGFEEVSLSMDGIPACTGDACLPKYKVSTHQSVSCMCLQHVMFDPSLCLSRVAQLWFFLLRMPAAHGPLPCGDHLRFQRRPQRCARPWPLPQASSGCTFGRLSPLAIDLHELISEAASCCLTASCNAD